MYKYCHESNKRKNNFTSIKQYCSYLKARRNQSLINLGIVSVQVKLHFLNAEHRLLYNTDYIYIVVYGADKKRKFSDSNCLHPRQSLISFSSFFFSNIQRRKLCHFDVILFVQDFCR